MRVLMLSRDASGLDPRSGTADRWRLLCEASAELEIIIAASSTVNWKEKNITVTGSGGGKLGRFWRAFWLARRKIGNADLVTAQDPFELGKIGWIIARLARKPFEIQDHGGFFDGRRPMEPLWFLRGRLARFLSHRADSIRTVSPLSREALAQEGMGQKVYHLAIAPRDKFANVERKPEPNLLVTVARLVPVKRTLLLLEAFYALHQKRPSARLAIIGDGPERGNIENRIRDLHLSDAVVLPGEGDPSPWLAKASGFVSLSAHEGWGIASVEAAMVGVPVLMTDTGCARWLEERGRAIVVRDVKEAPDAMARLLEMPFVPKKLLEVLSASETAREQVKRWQTVVRARVL